MDVGMLFAQVSSTADLMVFGSAVVATAGAIIVLVFRHANMQKENTIKNLNAENERLIRRYEEAIESRDAAIKRETEALVKAAHLESEVKHLETELAQIRGEPI